MARAVPTVRQDQDGCGLTYDGHHYTAVIGPIHDISVSEDTGLRMSFGWEPSTTCYDCPHGHVHEVPGAERVASTMEEAVAKGWLARD